MKVKYGMSLRAAEMWLAKGCQICGGEATHIDHDHETDEVRGALCSHHNTGLGLFQDNPDLLRQAVAYLELGPLARTG